MRNLNWVSAIAVSVATMSVSPAHAAKTFTYFEDVAGEFGNTAPGLNAQGGPFSDVFTFTTTRALLGSITFSSTGSTSSSARTYLNFTGATINGATIPIAITTGTTLRTSEGNLLDFRLPAGPQTLILTGTRGRLASYSGSFSLAAVPEASTWAMMIVGVGMIGGLMRRKAVVARKTVFA